MYFLAIIHFSWEIKMERRYLFDRGVLSGLCIEFLAIKIKIINSIDKYIIKSSTKR